MRKLIRLAVATLVAAGLVWLPAAAQASITAKRLARSPTPSRSNRPHSP